jgi:hypothetical protein
MQIVCNGSSPAPELHLELLDHPSREARADQAPHAGVTRVVHHVEHDPGDGQVGEKGAAVLPIAALLRGVGIRVAEYLAGLGVRRHRPEALPIRGVSCGFVPVDRRLATVAVEDRVRETAREGVEIREIDPRHHTHPGSVSGGARADPPTCVAEGP